MTKEEAIHILKYERDHDPFCSSYRQKVRVAMDMAIEALKMQEYDEIVFDMNEFFSIVDDGKITVMRRGKGRVTVERPAMRLETTIFSYGEGSEDE